MLVVDIGNYFWKCNSDDMATMVVVMGVVVVVAW